NLSHPLYAKLTALNGASLEAMDRYYAEQTLQWFERAGVGLDEQKRARVRALTAEITQLGQEFLTNIRNDNRQVELTVNDLDGLPADYIASRKIDAQGKLQLTTNYPD